MRTNILITAVVLAGAVALAGCTEGGNENVDEMQQQAQEAVDKAQAQTKEAMAKAQAKVDELLARYQPLDEDVPQRAVAVLHPTEGNDVTGTVTFTPAENGLKVHTEASGLSPGKHGYHLHIYGDCTAADGTSAGTHFNLQGSSLNPPKDIDRITGNLGNLDAGEDGNATHEAVIENAKLTGAKSIVGRAVIVHEKPNDPEQPPIGGAGPRLACGVVGIGNPEAE